MEIDQRAELRRIRSFQSLVKYLRDELGWPIETDDFEELWFDYAPEELGIDGAIAAKIDEIKRLRPLTPNQPWGIFFVKFEPKRLPVVALRRILGRVVVKKRASANSADRVAWAADDLLFISNFGAGDERQISLAHFSHAASKGDLPVLKVLGWDNLDSPLHLDRVAESLGEYLAWPADDQDAEGWREQWRSAFTLGHREVITTSKLLAERLARLARAIRDRIGTALAIESEQGPLTKLLEAFREALVHDLDPDGFADMYAQTIAYGLLSARISEPKADTVDDFAKHMRTSPFLRELMETFLGAGEQKAASGGAEIDFDELGVSDVIELLDNANMEDVVRDFGDRKPQEDPVIHFYELFLQEYDARKRIERGVFYTPRPVVSYIVRSVHQLLQTDFGLRDGLADTTTWGEMAQRHEGLTIPEGVGSTDCFISLLDPATGTGTFLVEAIDVIHSTLVERWRGEGAAENELSDLWNDYVPTHLLPRLHGYELLMAPYAIAHLKVGLKLHETGYRFESEERARIYLTNALEPAQDFSGTLAFAIPALAHEAEAVNDVKRTERFTIIVGNPPYAGHSRNNDIKWIVDLVKDFSKNEPSLQGPGQKKWLQDDYVKFLRLGEYILAAASHGVLAMITNHRYLTNRTFKGMRRLWLANFAAIRILDLHGNRVVNEVSPLGSDANVFDIEQGVAIGMFVKGHARLPEVAYAERWGERTSLDGEGKYDFLATNSLETTDWQQIQPPQPDWLFAPRGEAVEDVRAEFDEAVKLDELMPGVLGPNRKPQSGLATMHDGFALSFTLEEVEEKIRAFTATDTRKEAEAIFGNLCNPQQWDYQVAKKALLSETWRGKIASVWVAPFDTRFTVYDTSVAVHLRRRLSDQLVKRDNIGLVVGGAGQEIGGDEWDAVSCVNGLLQLNYFRRNGSPTLPLYIYESEVLAGETHLGRRPNLSEPQLQRLANRLGLRITKSGLPRGLTAEDIFHYTYALFHSLGYRARYAELLKIDFPRLPLTSRLELFRELADLGEELVDLHLVEAPAQQAVAARYDEVAKAWCYEVEEGQELPITLSFNGRAKPVVCKIGWSADTVWIDTVKEKKDAAGVTGTVGFHGVPEHVWKFHIGGYNVCEKWLKDRGPKKGQPGRTLTAEDIAHYHRIVIAVHETVRLMREIDEAVDAYGGWPAAFHDPGEGRASAIEKESDPDEVDALGERD